MAAGTSSSATSKATAASAPSATASTASVAAAASAAASSIASSTTAATTAASSSSSSTSGSTVLSTDTSTGFQFVLLGPQYKVSAGGEWYLRSANSIIGGDTALIPSVATISATDPSAISGDASTAGTYTGSAGSGTAVSNSTNTVTSASGTSSQAAWLKPVEIGGGIVGAIALLAIGSFVYSKQTRAKEAAEERQRKRAELAAAARTAQNNSRAADPSGEDKKIPESPVWKYPPSGNAAATPVYSNPAQFAPAAAYAPQQTPYYSQQGSQQQYQQQPQKQQQQQQQYQAQYQASLYSHPSVYSQSSTVPSERMYPVQQTPYTPMQQGGYAQQGQGQRPAQPRQERNKQHRNAKVTAQQGRVADADKEEEQRIRKEDAAGEGAVPRPPLALPRMTIQP
ncbi:hypothetical protein HDU82_001612, partial [Entophlyctis luteolus]